MDAPASLAPALALGLPATYVLSVTALIVEFLVLRWLKEPGDRCGEWASVISGGLAFGLLALANRLVFVGLMMAVWHARLFDLGVTALAFGAAFLVYDLMFYLAHRAGHEIRLLWCFHSVHHTSEDMRLVAAIRGSAFDFVYLPWFFVWIPLLGIHPAIVLLVEVFGRLWGVATHVSPRLVGRLGTLDRLVVTPSVHRVHHGRNEPYLDRNYGEVLTLWDWLLGTYQAELDDERPDYGVRKAIDAGSVRAIQLSPWVDLARDLRRTPGVLAKLRVLFDAPGWSHDGPDERVRAVRRAAKQSES